MLVANTLQATAAFLALQPQVKETLAATVVMVLVPILQEAAVAEQVQQVQLLVIKMVPLAEPVLYGLMDLIMQGAVEVDLTPLRAEHQAALVA